ncbi:DUF4365 domain-containing protein [Massilia sp. CFBP9012]|uniref:DUF4365 domain-containing protein n=1 Tax=Massilia sp. CFBP9012 TaxID=3096531 RepID=UPI002A6B54DD|nr:DUF4365 domain-containing protein [Massilia sp. CFBP9012]MDY0974977.1 DUF4365 domain-containing protein [Massilia sp. CFBP9012]
MHISNQKELFNVAYVHAMAAQAGLNHGSMTIDDDSLDLIIAGKGFGQNGGLRNPQMHLQLKCTSQDLISGEYIKFPLSMKNYDDLRATNVVAPCYLVVLVVPEDVKSWAHHDSHSMILNHCCYWVSLKGMPSSHNTGKIVVNVPLSQRLTPDAMYKLMTLASKSGVV